LTLLSYFSTDVPIIIDDVHRKPERMLMEKVAKRLEHKWFILEDGATGVIGLKGGEV